MNLVEAAAGLDQCVVRQLPPVDADRELIRLADVTDVERPVERGRAGLDALGAQDPCALRLQLLECRLQVPRVRTLESLQKKPLKAVLVSFFLRFGQAGNSGIVQTYLISFITITLAISKEVGPEIVIVSSLIGFLTIPLVGFLGDKFGRRRMYIVMSALSLVLIVPTLLMINSREVGAIFVGYALIHNISVLGLASMENISIPEIFGARNRYTLTADGLNFAIFYSKVHDRILRPLMAADRPPTPTKLRTAMRAIDQHINQRLTQARLPTAA